MIKDVDITFCTYFSHIDVFKFEVETYDTYTAFCLYSGCFAYRVGNLPEKLLSANELVICPPGKPFYRRVVDSCELFMIKFKILNGTAPIEESIAVHDASRYRQDLDNLRGCLFCRNMQENPLYTHYCKDVIYMSNFAVGTSPSLARAESIIKSGDLALIRVEELAKTLGYTTVHFINLFKKHYGCTPGEYIAEVKLKRAASLLLRTEKTSRDVAMECGFTDELYFIRFFKKHTGMTPTEYRRAHFVSLI